MRASSYNIYISLPDEPEHELLIHGYTGAVDKVSKELATYIRSLKFARASVSNNGHNGHYAPSSETIEILKRRGYITDKPKGEEEAFFVKMATRLQASNLISPPSYVFMLTYDCNLRCPYCYQEDLRLNRKQSHLFHTHGEFVRMDKAMIDNIFRGIRDIESAHSFSNTSKNREITLYGGEPLRATNREIVEYIMSKAKDYEGWDTVSFFAVSNGTELHHYEDLLGEDGISSLQITLDGPPRIHNKLRVYADGRGSFDQIAKNISMAIEKGAYVGLRVNVDRNNIIYLPELADIIEEMGWAHHASLFSAHVAPIQRGVANTRYDTEHLYSTWELHQEIESLKEQYENMRIFSVGRYVRVKSKLFKLMGEEKEQLGSMSPIFCGAHAGMYVIDPTGDIYACWERVGDRNIRIGYIENGRFVRTSMYHMWKSRHVGSNVVCRQCPYALFCGGGCASQACIVNGNMFTNYCDGFKSLFHDAARAAYRDFLDNEVEQEKSPYLCDT